MFKKKWIKAYNCYVCNKLFSPEYQGGYVVAKRYSFLGNPKDVSICRDCAERIANQIKKEKEEHEPNDI